MSDLEKLTEENAKLRKELKRWKDLDLERPAALEMREHVMRGGKPMPEVPEWAHCQKEHDSDPAGFGRQLMGLQSLWQKTLQQSLSRDQRIEGLEAEVEARDRRIAELEEQLAAHSVATTKDQGSERITDLIDRLLEEDRLQREARSGK